MFRPLGSIIPDAVFADIGLFFDKNQLHQFSLASPRANGLFESYRMMAYKTVTINMVNYKFSIGLEDSNIDDTKRKIYIDTNNEDITEKMAIFYRRKMYLEDCTISVSLPLFLKFLYRHGKILTLESVRLPGELVSNKTLKLISYFNILPMEGTDLDVDVTDEFLEGNNTEFNINGFLTKFTIKGIFAFIQKNEHRYTSFGILDSEQMQDAIDFERHHSNEWNRIDLLSTEGRKMLGFCVIIGMNNWVTFSIILKMTEIDQFGMLPVPSHLFGIVAQESVVKFDKICSIPERPRLHVSQYQMDSLCIIQDADHFYMRYNIRGENRKIILQRSDVTLKDAQKIIVEILRNCTSIEELRLSRIELDEEFYHLLKPIAHNIRITYEWSIKTALGPESLREVKTANTGLFGSVKLEFPRRYGSNVNRLIKLFESC